MDVNVVVTVESGAIIVNVYGHGPARIPIDAMNKLDAAIADLDAWNAAPKTEPDAPST